MRKGLLQPQVRLHAEAAAATTGGFRVRVRDFEAASIQIFVEIDHGTIQVQKALLIDNQAHAVLLAQ